MILRINYNLASCVQHQIYKRCFQQEKKQLVIFSPGSAKNSLEITNVSMQWWLTFWKFAEWNAEVYSTACQSVWRSMEKTLPSHLQKHSCTGLRCSRSIFISVEIISDSKQNYFDLNAKCKKKKKIIHLHSPFSVAYPGSSCLNIHVLPSHHLQLFKKKPEEPAEPHVHRVLPMGHTQMPHPAGILIRCPNQLDWRQNDHKQIQNNHKVNPADSQSW